MMSNEIRDGIYRLLQRLLIMVRMISTTTQVEKELEGLIKLAPRLRPFDLSVKLDHILGDSIWQTPLRRLGSDVTVISLNASKSTNSQTARNIESTGRLQIGEKEKFNRDGYTDNDTGITLSGQEIIHEILKTDSALMPKQQIFLLSVFSRRSYSLSSAAPPNNRVEKWSLRLRPNCRAVSMANITKKDDTHQ